MKDQIYQRCDRVFCALGRIEAIRESFTSNWVVSNSGGEKRLTGCLGGDDYLGLSLTLETASALSMLHSLHLILGESVLLGERDFADPLLSSI